MKFSARVSYGLRAAIQLASQHGSGLVLAKDISDAENLPSAYLEQILTSLRRADIVEGTRGARGGYALRRAPEAISVAELIAALDGPVHISDCPDGPACCGHPETCAVNELYRSTEAALESVFSAQTLADLLERRRELASGGATYQI